MPAQRYRYHFNPQPRDVLNGAIRTLAKILLFLLYGSAIIPSWIWAAVPQKKNVTKDLIQGPVFEGREPIER
jgi:hypothetical protein